MKRSEQAITKGRITPLIIHLKMWLFLLLPYLSDTSVAQEYDYDANGNLVKDPNKGISSIHYNPYNLPDTITFQDGRKIVYFYTAKGEKLSQQVLEANGTLQAKRDYVGDFLYKNDTLQEITHPEGRIIPLLGAAWNGAGHEYQYHLADHLGNTRLTFTTNRDTLEYLATMEREQAPSEGSFFENLDLRVPSTSANHTPGGNEAVRIDHKHQPGPSLTLPVYPGDGIWATTWAYYEKAGRGNKGSLNALLLAAMTHMTGAGKPSVDGQKILKTTHRTAGSLVASKKSNRKKAPNAYLNYLVTDKNARFIDGGFTGVSRSARMSQEKLALPSQQVKIPGYLQVYLNSREENPRAVFFDDLLVTHLPSPITQENAYYPFGMSISGTDYLRAGSLKNRYLYNGKELQDDYGLGWYDYGARMYDAALGRWHVIDPLAEKYGSWSPYNYVMDNPLKFIDPDGQDLVIWYKENDQDKSYRYKGGNPKDLPNNKFVRQVALAYNYNVNNGGGDNLKKLAETNQLTVNVRESERGSFYSSGKKTILWDPTRGLATTKGYALSPATGLEHEADHALLHLTDPKTYKKLGETKVKGYSDAEEKRVITGSERKTAIANGEMKKGQQPRTHDKPLFYKTESPISTKRKPKPVKKSNSGIIEELE